MTCPLSRRHVAVPKRWPLKTEDGKGSTDDRPLQSLRPVFQPHRYNLGLTYSSSSNTLILYINGQPDVTCLMNWNPISTGQPNSIGTFTTAYIGKSENPKEAT